MCVFMYIYKYKYINIYMYTHLASATATAPDHHAPMRVGTTTCTHTHIYIYIYMHIYPPRCSHRHSTRPPRTHACRQNCAHTTSSGAVRYCNVTKTVTKIVTKTVTKTMTPPRPERGGGVHRADCVRVGPCSWALRPRSQSSAKGETWHRIYLSGSA